VDPAEELRWLEGGQRLVAQRRNVVRLSEALPQHVGAGLWQATARHGAAALGRDAGVLAPGMRADWVVLDTDHPRAWGRQGDHLVDTWVMAGGRELVREVWVAGERVVAEGVHVRHRQVAASCRAAMKRLFARL
jgi:formimidoylglutamate deiminase